MFRLKLRARGPYSVWAGLTLRKMARERGLYPAPLTPEFLIDLAWSIADEQERSNFDDAGFRAAIERAFRRVMVRIEDPTKRADSYSRSVDPLLARYELAPLPTGVEVDTSAAATSPEKTEVQERIQSMIESGLKGSVRS